MDMNDNALITINRHEGNFITKLAFTNRGCFQQITVNTTTRNWRAFAFIETDGSNNFNTIGNVINPVYVGSLGKIKPCKFAANKLYMSDGS
jgi:hypothetical protein